MNVPQENIVGSCEYTPVYLIQSPVVTLPDSFVAPNTVPHLGPKPVSDNLKKFYESSGNLENSLQHNNPIICQSRILKKHPIPVNSYKLSSFLTPKSKLQNNLEKKCTVSVNNVLQQSLPAGQNGVINVSSILNMDRKIVKLKHLPSNSRHIPRPAPKTKPKEISLNIPNSSSIIHSIPVKPNILSSSSNSGKPKLTSVQLLKLGETYHSLNQLSDGQMKIVNQALKIFSDPENIPVEPTYDPVTNTKFIYKVVSPKDLTIVGKNKIVIKQKDSKKVIQKTIEKVDSEIIDNLEQKSILQAKVTRSGRMVKLPKQLIEEKKLLLKKEDEKIEEDIDYCSQCCEEFKGLYNLKQDKKEEPSKIQSSLFNYLLAIVKNAPEADKASIFIQQLEQLIEKIKLLLPCLLKKIGGSQGKQCTVNDDIGRLFNMIPGAYNLNMDALSCEKDAEGFCTHNPKRINPTVKLEVNSVMPEKVKEDEIEECARIKPISQWTVKRSWNTRKNSKVPKMMSKKIRLTSENTEPPIELGTEDQNCLMQMVEQSTDNATTFQSSGVLDTQVTPEIVIDIPPSTVNQNIPKGSHEQFYSAHFDIRSSPIKSSSSVFRKFQITPTILPKSDVQIMKPLENHDLNNQTEEMVKEELPPEINDLSILQEMFKNDVGMPCSDKEVNDVCQVLNFDDAKNWELSNNSEPPITNECTDSLIESALMHVTGDSTMDKTSDQIELASNDSGQSVLNFLESLGNELAYPETETEIRNNTIDFHLDLFSFHNS